MLAQALAHAHARGVIHRDVKPQNVLVPHDPDTHEAPAKLTDFGGASLSGEDALTRTGETLGTLAYMAPEQSEGREVGEPADLYSLALVLYEGLTGVNPCGAPLRRPPPGASDVSCPPSRHAAPTFRTRWRMPWTEPSRSIRRSGGPSRICAAPSNGR